MLLQKILNSGKHGYIVRSFSCVLTNIKIYVHLVFSLSTKYLANYSAKSELYNISLLVYRNINLSSIITLPRTYVRKGYRTLLKIYYIMFLLCYKFKIAKITTFHWLEKNHHFVTAESLMYIHQYW